MVAELLCRKQYKPPRRPYEKSRLEAELKLCGLYGLRNKREIWRVAFLLRKIRKTARELLTLDEMDPQRVFQGTELIHKLISMGVLEESKNKLDYVLGLKVEDFFERRLQTIVYQRQMAKSIHHARCMIVQRHIAIGKQIVTQPSFAVNLETENLVCMAVTSSLNGFKDGRVRKRKAKQGSSTPAEEEED